MFPPLPAARPQVLLGPLEFQKATSFPLPEALHALVTFLHDENGGMPGLVALLASTDPDARAQAAWEVGCMSMAQPDTHSLMIEAGAAAPLVALLQSAAASLHSNSAAAQAAAIALQFLSRDGSAAVDALVAAGAVEALAGAARDAPAGCSALLQARALEALQNLAVLASKGHSQLRAPLAKSEVLEAAVSALRSPTELVAEKTGSLLEALAWAGSLTASGGEAPDAQQQQETITRSFSTAIVIQALAAAMQHASSAVIVPAAQALSCLCAGNPASIAAAVAADAIPPLCVLLKRPAPASVHKAAVCLISCIATGGTYRHQQAKLAEYGAVGGMCALLNSTDVETAKVTASALANMCRGKERCDEAVAAGAVPLLAALLHSPAAVDQALAALRNVATGRSIAVHTAFGTAVPRIVRLLHYRSAVTAERSASVLSLLVKAKPVYSEANVRIRTACMDEMIFAGAIVPLVALLGAASLEAVCSAVTTLHELSGGGSRRDVVASMKAAGVMQHRPVLAHFAAFTNDSISGMAKALLNKLDRSATSKA